MHQLTIAQTILASQLTWVSEMLKCSADCVATAIRYDLAGRSPERAVPNASAYSSRRRTNSLQTRGNGQLKRARWRSPAELALTGADRVESDKSEAASEPPLVQPVDCSVALPCSSLS